MTLAALLRLPPRSRLLDAERRFFDSYSRGGTHAPRDLVVPLGYFARADVRRALEDWATGRASLDEATLERAWRAEGGSGDVGRFYRNLAHFLALAQ